MINNQEQTEAWVLRMLRQTGAHIIEMDNMRRGVTLISAAVYGTDYWILPAFGGTFRLPHPPKKYDRFRLPAATRPIVHWLSERESQGASTCGILAVFNTGPLTEYACYIPAWLYTRRVLDEEISAAGIILGKFVRNIEDIKIGADLLGFINESALSEDKA